MLRRSRRRRPWLRLRLSYDVVGTFAFGFGFDFVASDSFSVPVFTFSRVSVQNVVNSNTATNCESLNIDVCVSLGDTAVQANVHCCHFAGTRLP